MSPPLVRPAGGLVHFSELKEFDSSPAHYRHACLHPKEQTRAMLVGAVADALVFQHRKVEVWQGTRSMAGYKAWEKEWADSDCYTCTASEHADASGAAEAVLRNADAKRLLESPTGQRQRVLQWESWGHLRCGAGIPGVRGGFDLLDDKEGIIADMKVTADASLAGLERQILRQHWHAQLAWYRDGAEQLGMRGLRTVLICVEATEPHPVTVVELLPELVQLGHRQCAAWTETLRACDASGVWPEYAQEVVRMGVPAWVDDA
jgi:hypothetical protein